MGVLFSSGDDVVELLIPFVMRHGGTRSIETIQSRYLAASLGEIGARAFWESVGIDHALEDDYLSSHCLMPGICETLDALGQDVREICCLSNDVSEWSKKLRMRSGLDQKIKRWFISADLGVRKPNIEIYEKMLHHLSVRGEDVVFVDDRPINVEAAKKCGILALLYNRPATYEHVFNLLRR